MRWITCVIDEHSFTKEHVTSTKPNKSTYRPSIFVPCAQRSKTAAEKRFTCRLKTLDRFIEFFLLWKKIEWMIWWWEWYEEEEFFYRFTYIICLLLIRKMIITWTICRREVSAKWSIEWRLQIDRISVPRIIWIIRI